MKLENQVVSLDLAKKLKELGVKQESQFNWWKGIGVGRIMPNDWSQFNMEPKPMYDTADVKEKISAFTVAELGEMLPIYICDPARRLSKQDKKCFSLQQRGFDEDYVDDAKPISFEVSYNGTEVKTREDTEADARAKMLIYLLENKIA